MQEFDPDGDAPGDLVPYGERSYYRPEPLPPSRTLQLDHDFYRKLAEATFWLGKLSGVSLELEFTPVLYTSLLRKEAMASAEIEGADVDFDALYSLETHALEAGASVDAVTPSETENETKDTREVLNYEQAIKQGIDALDARTEMTVDLLHELHKVLLTDVPDDRAETGTIGAFKNTPNHLGAFIPPVPDAVDGLMDALVTYYRTGGRYHPIVDIALFHYQFETIHPYGDGNGRLGRLLITLQLYDAGYLDRPNLYLSEFFNRNKAMYIDLLNAVRTDGEWESWLTFFVEGVTQQARESVDRTRALEELRQRYEAEYGGVSYTKNRLARSLFERPYVTTRTVAERFDVEQSTASRAINALETEGVLEEVTGNRRNKEYRASEIFEILERPPQTY